MQKQQQTTNTLQNLTTSNLPTPLNSRQQQKQIKQNTQVPSTCKQQDNQNNGEQELVFQKICQYLRQKNVQFKVLQHEATRTSEQSANVRNTPLEWGSKTMLVTGVDNSLVLLIYRAHMKVNWKKIRKIPQIGKKAQMATQEHVLKLGVKPGGVPPFPHMIGLKGILDSKFKSVEMMAFNAGHKCKSIVMKTEDYPLQDISIGDITQD